MYRHRVNAIFAGPCIVVHVEALPSKLRELVSDTGIPDRANPNIAQPPSLKLLFLLVLHLARSSFWLPSSCLKACFNTAGGI